MYMWVCHSRRAMCKLSVPVFKVHKTARTKTACHVCCSAFFPPTLACYYSRNSVSDQPPVNGETQVIGYRRQSAHTPWLAAFDPDVLMLVHSDRCKGVSCWLARHPTKKRLALPVALRRQDPVTSLQRGSMPIILVLTKRARYCKTEIQPPHSLQDRDPASLLHSGSQLVVDELQRDINLCVAPECFRIFQGIIRIHLNFSRWRQVVFEFPGF